MESAILFYASAICNCFLVYFQTCTEEAIVVKPPQPPTLLTDEEKSVMYDRLNYAQNIRRFLISCIASNSGDESKKEEYLESSGKFQINFFYVFSTSLLNVLINSMTIMVISIIISKDTCIVC